MNEQKSEILIGLKKTISINIDLVLDSSDTNNNDKNNIFKKTNDIEISNTVYYKPGSIINEINKITEQNFINLIKIQPEIHSIVNEIILKMGFSFDSNNKDIIALNNGFKKYSCYLKNGKKLLIGLNNQKCFVNSGVFINGSKVLKLYNYEKYENEWVKYKFMREVALQKYAYQIMNHPENKMISLNIPIIFNYGEYDNEDKSYFFIIMDYVNGIYPCNTKKKINEKIKQRISDGVNLLFKYKLSHEDLRNANILFDKKTNIISLIDFGEAILTDKVINEPYIWNNSNGLFINSIF